MHAAELDNVHFMQLLLERDPDSVNMVDDEGATALCPPSTVNHRMNFGSGSDEHHETPLIYAITGALATFPDDTGSPPIHLAIRAERTDIVQDMLERGGFDINAGSPTGSGWTALYTAAHWAAVEIIQLLVAQEGIDADHPTHSGQMPLITAHYDGSIEALLAHPDVQVDHVDNNGRSALSYTAERGI
ncbi:ankyrin repeat-containing domain protein [Aspergillus desertorum]